MLYNLLLYPQSVPLGGYQPPPGQQYVQHGRPPPAVGGYGQPYHQQVSKLASYFS